jgi:class 3 adenylate cyclase
VNLASRLEGLCRTVDTTLVVSDSAAQELPAASLRDLGFHALKGLAAPVRVWGAIGR